MNEIILQEVDGRVLASSRDVAKNFDKRNPDVNRAIENLIVQNCTVKNMFEESTYISSRGRQEKEFLMDRDGFSLLVMGFTGKKALEWKLKYIEAFNKMEEKLKSSNILTEEEKLKLQLFSKDAAEVAFAHNKLVELATAPLHHQIEEQKPLVSFAKHVTNSSDAVDIGEFSKIVKKENINIGRNRLFEWFRKNKYLMKTNIPYQKYIEKNYFTVIETCKSTAYGERVFSKTLITGSGQVFFVEKLRKEFGIAA